MELDVLHLNGLAARRPARRLKHDFIVEAEPQLRHTGEIALHLNATQYFAAKHIPICADQQVEGLDDVQENLVFPISYTLASPRYSICHSDWRPRLHLKLVRLLRDVLLEDL